MDLKGRSGYRVCVILIQVHTYVRTYKYVPIKLHIIENDM